MFGSAYYLHFYIILRILIESNSTEISIVLGI